MKKSIIADEISSDLEEAFAVIHEMGFPYVELHNVFGKSIEQLSEEEVHTVRALLKKYDLKVSDLASTVFFLCPLREGDEVRGFSDSFHAVTGTVKDHLRWLENACRTASLLECPNIRLFPFRFPDNRKPPFGTKEDMMRIADAMRMASDTAFSWPVTLVVENCPYSHLPKGQMTLELVRMVDRNNVKLLYDPANSYRAVKENVPEEYLGWDTVSEVRQILPEIRHVHVKDYHYDPAVRPKPFIHVPCGEGDLDYPSVFKVLKKGAYEDACSLEPEVSRQGAIQSMKWLKEMNL